MTESERAALIAILRENAKELQDAWLSDPPREPSLNCALPAHLLSACELLSSSPPAAGCSVAPSLGSSDADALTQLLALSKKATPGPWGPVEFDDYGDEIWYGGEGCGTWFIPGPDAYIGGNGGDPEGRARSDADTAFIVAAVNYVRSLESKAQDGSSLLTTPDPVLSNGKENAT